MFTQTAEYALRAVTALAGQDRALTTAELARHTQVPPDYLAKVLRGLTRAGLITATRGPHGGHRLARPADQLSLLDVINATDPLRRIHHCPLGRPEHTSLCPLHRRLDDAARQIEEQFAQTRLSELTLDLPAPP